MLATLVRDMGPLLSGLAEAAGKKRWQPHLTTETSASVSEPCCSVLILTFVISSARFPIAHNAPVVRMKICPSEIAGELRV